MPNKPSVPCHYSRCPGRLSVQGERYCAEHLEAGRAEERARKAAQPGYMQNDAAWKRLKRMLEANGNVVCQKLEHGVRCDRPVQIWHHLLGSSRPDLRYSPENVIGLCRDHHPDTDGTPNWRPGIDYSPTIFSPPRF